MKLTRKQYEIFLELIRATVADKDEHDLHSGIRRIDAEEAFKKEFVINDTTATDTPPQIQWQPDTKQHRLWEYATNTHASLDEMGKEGWELIFYSEIRHPAEDGIPPWTEKKVIYKRERL